MEVCYIADLHFSCPRYQILSNALKEFVILPPIEGERADVLKTLGVDDILVVVLDSKFFPDDGARFPLHRQRYGTASDVGAFWADVERSSTVGHVRRYLSKKSIDAFLLILRV